MALCSLKLFQQNLGCTYKKMQQNVGSFKLELMEEIWFRSIKHSREPSNHFILFTCFSKGARSNYLKFWFHSVTT